MFDVVSFSLKLIVNCLVPSIVAICRIYNNVTLFDLVALEFWGFCNVDEHILLSLNFVRNWYKVLLLLLTFTFLFGVYLSHEEWWLAKIRTPHIFRFSERTLNIFGIFENTLSANHLDFALKYNCICVTYSFFGYIKWKSCRGLSCYPRTSCLYT